MGNVGLNGTQGFLNRSPFFHKYKSIGYLVRHPSNKVTQAEVDRLTKEGCKKIFLEQVHDEFIDQAKPELSKALLSMAEGDQLIVSSLNCLGDSQVSIISQVDQLLKKRIQIKTLDGLIDTKDIGTVSPAVMGFLKALLKIEPFSKSSQSLPIKKHKSNEFKNLGGRPRINEAKEKLVIRLRKEGYSYRTIRDQTSLALSTIRRVIVENSEP